MCRICILHVEINRAKRGFPPPLASDTINMEYISWLWCPSSIIMAAIWFISVVEFCDNKNNQWR